LFASLDGLQPGGETRLDRTLTQLTERMARRSLVVLVSDLFDVSTEARRMLRQLRARKHQVVVFHLLHDDEIDFPFSALTLFEGMESDRRVLVDPGGIRQAYLVQIQRFLETIERECKEGEVLYQLVRTSQSLDAVLLGLLRSREGRR